MTQRTINLYDGLEALYYFDSDYYDGTTGELKDKSGHGRHATAEGGPTIGVNGPNDFEAASFDGNDDNFEYFNPSSNNASNFSELSFTALVKNNVDDESVGITVMGNDKHGIETSTNGILKVKVTDSGNTSYDFKVGDLARTYSSITGVWDGTDLYGFVNGSLSAKRNTGSITLRSAQGIKIGQDNNQNYLSGEVAMVGWWSRAISDAEIEALNNLTAPRRSQL